MKKIATRSLTLLLGLLMVLAIAAPALAADISAYGMIGPSGANVYSATDLKTVLGTFPKDAIVAIELSGANNTYKIRTSSTGVATGYIKKADVAKSTTTLPTGKTVASMTAATGSSSTAGQPGVIANVKTDVNFRSAANTSSTSLGKLKLNQAVTILGEENGFYKLIANGKTGYVSKDYVKLTTPPVVTGKVSGVKTSAPLKQSASSTSKTLTSVKLGAAVTVLGTSGTWTNVKYNTYTGYIETKYITLDSASTGTGTGTTATTGGKDTGAITVAKKATDIKIQPSASPRLSSTAAAGLSAAQKKNSDTVGYINIAGTNIQQPILFRAGSYYDNHNLAKASDSKGAVHTLYKGMVRNNTITAHNLRGSNAMFHQLLHLHEKALGKTTCQTTDYKCKAASLDKIPDLKVAKNRIWEISLFGYSQWEVWAMYETPANEPKATINYNILPLSQKKDTTATIKKWIETQKTKSQVKFNTPVSTADIFLTVYTCGTNFDYSEAQSRCYFFLKAVK